MPAPDLVTQVSEAAPAVVNKSVARTSAQHTSTNTISRQRSSHEASELANTQLHEDCSQGSDVCPYPIVQGKPSESTTSYQAAMVNFEHLVQGLEREGRFKAVVDGIVQVQDTAMRGSQLLKECYGQHLGNRINVPWRNLVLAKAFKCFKPGDELQKVRNAVQHTKC